MLLKTFIESLKENELVWKEFQPKSDSYSEFFKEVDKFLKSKNINILHGYDNETLRIEYIIYYKGEIVDFDNNLNLYANPYWTIILNCFKFLNEQQKQYNSTDNKS